MKSTLNTLPEPAKNDYNGTRVRLCEDGKYRWTYPLDLLRNPTILFTVLKIFGVLFSIPILILLISTAVKGNWAEAWEEDFKIWIIVLVVFLAIVLVSYLIVARMYKGKYVVRFTMDQGQLVHQQVPVQFQQAQKTGALIAIAGILTKQPITAGAGALAASRDTSTSVYEKVRSIKPHRAWNLIKVNQRLNRNQVYVPAEDFDFVLDYIRQHCPNAK